MRPASGTMASAEVTNTATGLTPYQSSATASGINTNSQFRLIAVPVLKASQHGIASGRPFETQHIFMVTKQRVQMTYLCVTVGPARVFQIQDADLVFSIAFLCRLEYRRGAIDGSIGGVDKFLCVQDPSIGDAHFVLDLDERLVDLRLCRVCRHFSFHDTALVPIENRERHTQAKGPLLLVVRTVGPLNRVSDLCRHVGIWDHSGQLQLGLSFVTNEP